MEEIRIIGACLERIGIPNGGIAVIDREAKPNVFDVVWCDTACSSIGGCLKQLIQTGNKPIVHTAYIDRSKDYAFYTPKIFGVVLKVMDYDRNVVWERPEPIEYAPVRHGRWIDCSNGWMCSFCEKDNTHDKPYCPNCGAVMDLEVCND